ncbi:MAG: c-type cytochrome [Chloroflexi bacterium]|nr:c-type cytochrome [Chloroflexota bacterium]
MNRIRHGRRIGRLSILGAIVFAIAGILIACGQQAADPSEYGGAAVDLTVVTDIELSPGAKAGEAVFAGNCAACHGAGAAGTYAGPTLIHQLYHPNHHSDGSIRVAAAAGVRQHHWNFGDMPPVAGISPVQIEQVICYVREIQFANGVFEDPSLLPAC